MTTVLNPAVEDARAATQPRDLRVALLGLGQVGSAVASIASEPAYPGVRLSIAATLVRDPLRPRGIDTSALTLTTDPGRALACCPDIVVEVLGGLEPARTLVLRALDAGIPVVTANKSLLAHHGDELFAAADRAGVPLFYEASVLAGVPFLGTFRHRPLARSVKGVQGIVNGTSNFILSRMAHDGVDFGTALAEAQRAGYAEADPSKDVDGDDTVEKLCVLLRHFADCSVSPAQIERRGIGDVRPHDLQHAEAFGGAIRPVAIASWTHGTVTAYAGPAFVERAHRLCNIDGVQNAVSLTTAAGDHLFFSGPGAGPAVTAATVLDDVVEAAATGPWRGRGQARTCQVAKVQETAWFIRLTSPALAEQDGPQLLTALGVRLRRVSHVDARGGQHHQWLLTQPCGRDHIAAALDVLAARTGSLGWVVPCLE